MKTRLTVVVCATVIGLLSAAPAKAAVLYSYTGDRFDTFIDNTPPAGSYTSSMSVSGTFIVAVPLLSLPASTNISGSVLSYSFSDGRQTLDDSNSVIFSFLMSTNGAGAPLGWTISVFTPFPFPAAIGDSSNAITINKTLSSFDRAEMRVCTIVTTDDRCVSFTGDRAQISNSGTWRVTTVSEPSSLALMLVSLAGLGAFARRRKAVKRGKPSRIDRSI